MATWQAEHTLDTSADPEEVWRRLVDVHNWPEWDVGLTWAELTGPFGAGALGRMKVRGAGTQVFRLVAVEANRTFTATVRLPLAVVRHIHSQEPSDMGTRMTHRVEIAGLLSWFYGLTRGRRLRDGLAPSMRSLARIASQF